MSNESVEDATTQREGKHIVIDQALNHLEKQVSDFQNFVTNLSEGPVPAGEGPNAKPPVPSFLGVYSNVADRIHRSTNELSESMGLIKDMLL